MLSLAAHQIKEQYSLEYQDGEDIFRTCISSKPEDWEFVMNSTKLIKSVCGGTINIGDLSFQCFTCSPDSNHLICETCFQPNIHQDHRATMQHDLGGCCDCGDEQIINPSGFCSSHNGVNISNMNLTIPSHLELEIKKFIHLTIELYLSQIELIEPLIEKIDPYILKRYKSIEKFPKLHALINETGPYQYFFEQSTLAVRYYKLLIVFLSWIINSRMNFLNLVTQTLMIVVRQPLSLMEEILSKQVILEEFSPSKIEDISELFCEFHSSTEFKMYQCQIFFKNYTKFYRISIKQRISLQKIVYQIIEEYTSGYEELNIQYIQDIIKKYNRQLRESHFDNIQLFQSELHSYHTQFVSTQYQQALIDHPNLFEILDLHSTIHNLIIKSHTQNPSMLISYLNIFKWRFQIFSFNEICLQNIKRSFHKEFKQFSENQIDDFINFDFRGFFISNYIQSFSLCLPASLELNQDYNVLELQNVLNYCNYQMRAIENLKIAFTKIIELKQLTNTLKENLVNIMIYQCFDLISRFRNQAQEDSYAEYYKKYTEDQHYNSQDQPIEYRLYFKQLQNASCLDQFFIFFLAYQYCAQELYQKEKLVNYLQNIFHLFTKDFQIIFQKILTRCLINLMSIYKTSIFPLIFQMYFGLHKACDNECIESYNIFFIKLYLFIFGEGELNLIENILKQINPTEYQEFLVIIFVKLMSSDQDLYNVCGSMFSDKLPLVLQSTLEKVVGNLFLLKTVLSYQEILKYSKMISFCQVNLQRHILSVCELSQDIHLLKLSSTQQKQYEPALFENSNFLNSLIIEKLMESKDPAININFGNRCLLDSQIKNQQILRVQIRKMLSNKELILKQIDLLDKTEHEEKPVIKFLYGLLLGYKYLKPEQFQLDLQELQFRMSALLQITNINDKNKPLIQEVVALIFSQPNQESNALTINRSDKLNKIQLKYKQKNEIFEQSLQTTQMQFNQEENQLILEVDEICQGCKQPLSNIEACIPILIQGSQLFNYFKIHTEQVQKHLNYQKDQLLNISQITISCCRHAYHKACLNDIMLRDENKSSKNLPNWVKLLCPVCKYSLNLTLPISQNKSEEMVKEFNLWLITLIIDIDLGEKLKIHYEKMDNLSVLANVYMQLFMDLVNCLLLDSFDFEKHRKQVLFQNLIDLARITFKDKQQYLEIYKYPENCDLTFEIINFIVKILINQKNEIEDNIKLYGQIMETEFNNNRNKEITFLLASSLGIHLIDDKKPQQQSIQKFKIQEDSKQINSHIAYEIKLQLGINFQIFYNKHFFQQCFSCKFYPENATSALFVCLICEYQSCSQTCKEKEQNENGNEFGNLNQHALTYHSGLCLFINVSDGAILIMCSPISISGYKNLYLNNIGQSIAVSDYLEKQEDYKLDEIILQQLVEIIARNNYKYILRNIVISSTNIDRNGAR